ncbi:MAG: hypothetical protein LBT40_13530 [Deltaproteobacteria bacterium]|jgi:hypothetical protein|nr:hypothetical protein [Deltaproteobacteria bacterium]
MEMILNTKTVYETMPVDCVFLLGPFGKEFDDELNDMEISFYFKGLAGRSRYEHCFELTMLACKFGAYIASLAFEM